MIINQYVGTLSPETSLDNFINSVKEDLRKEKVSSESLKVDDKNGTLNVSCISPVADIIRKRKEIVRFRCEKVGT